MSGPKISYQCFVKQQRTHILTQYIARHLATFNFRLKTLKKTFSYTTYIFVRYYFYAYGSTKLTSFLRKYMYISSRFHMI
jgi:hypothetical protein